MFKMQKMDQRGSLVVPLVVTGALLLVALIFGFWAFAGMQDYKNNSDIKSAEAAEAAVAQNSLEKDAQFAEESKNPNKSYKSPSAYGSVTVVYPKTWSAYVDETGKSAMPVNGYLHPNFVPATDNIDINYALRFEISQQAYDLELNKLTPQVKIGATQVSAYRAPKVSDVLGSKITGDIGNQKQGVLVLLPLRDKTIKIWTEGSEFTSDFNKILENLTFVP